VDVVASGSATASFIAGTIGGAAEFGAGETKATTLTTATGAGFFSSHLLDGA
jgi:hypothetical protein